MACLHGRCMAVAVLCVQLAFQTTLAKKDRDPYGTVIEDAASNAGSMESPPNRYPRVQSMLATEGSASLFDRLDQYQRAGAGAEASVKQVTYVKTPYSIGYPYLDPHRRAWVPIRPDIGAIDETLAETGAKSVGRSHRRSGGSSRIWLLAPFTIGEPSYDDATKGTFVPFYSAKQDSTGLYQVHSPNPDELPMDQVFPDNKAGKPPDPKMYECGGKKDCQKKETCQKCTCSLLSNLNPFGSCKKSGCCGKSMRVSSKSIGDATDFPPLPRSSYMSQPTYPYAVSYPPMTPWTPPVESAGQFGGEQFNDYRYDGMSDEYGAPQ